MENRMRKYEDGPQDAAASGKAGQDKPAGQYETNITRDGDVTSVERVDVSVQSLSGKACKIELTAICGDCDAAGLTVVKLHALLKAVCSAFHNLGRFGEIECHTSLAELPGKDAQKGGDPCDNK